MPGETNIAKLLASLSPTLMDGEFVFCIFEGARYGDLAHLEPICAVSESEGLTLIIPLLRALEYGLAYEAVYKGITLGVHSSLDAVGLTAAFSSRLADHGISANVVAGYYHDHVFVGCEHAQRALEALTAFENTSLE